MAPPLVVRLVMDAVQYLRTTDTATSSITAFGEANLRAGEAVQISSIKQVNASLRATEAIKTQIAGYRELAASAEQSAVVRERAALLASRAEGRLNSQLGLSTALGGTSAKAQTAERDLGKFTRGALAGSGAASSLGRSLAFASTGFIAIAGASTLIASSIKASLDLQKTQRQVEAQLKTSGKSWDVYGQRIDQADLKLSHISGFTNQELLQGFGYLIRVNNNVGESLKLTSEAADVARGRNISLASAAIALAKAQGGSLTALRRLGIVVPANVKGLDALAYVQQKFAGQAQAGATVGDRFHASLVNTEEIIGNALLPTFTRLTTEITDWLAKMNETGRLQRDVNEAVTIGGKAFHALGAIIGFVDKVTGSFGNTLKILLEIYLGREIIKALVYVDRLAASWFGVAEAANSAAAAEGRAVGVAEGAGAAAGGAGLFAGLATGPAIAAEARSAALRGRIGAYTGEAAAGEGAAAGAGIGAGAAGLSLTGVGALAVAATIAAQQLDKFAMKINPTLGSAVDKFFGFASFGIIGNRGYSPEALGARAIDSVFGLHPSRPPVPPPAYLTHLQQSGGLPQFLQLSGTLGAAQRNPRGLVTPQSPFGGATPLAVYSKYTQTITEQIAVAQAALSKTTKDDVVAAKSIIQRIKRLIAEGHLQGASLIQALQDEASQQGVLDNARQAAAQQAAKIAAAKQAAASSYTTPIDLQLAEARSQLTRSTADDVQVEKRILAAARAALNSGTKNKQGQLAALQVMLQAQQAIQSLTSQSDSTFTLPLKLQLALARAQALGGDQTKILLQEKAALERALKASKGNIQKQIDIYNQIASINQQLGADANVAFGQYRQASLAAETAGLGLNKAQRKALEARLSQRGPGGTMPGSGTGAGGFIIGPDGRPIQVHHHRRPHHGQDTQGADGGPRKLQATFNIRVYLDGRDVTHSVTVRQQRTRDRNPSQRRGPHAGKQTA